MSLGLNNIPVFKIVIAFIAGIFLADNLNVSWSGFLPFIGFVLGYLLLSLLLIPKRSTLKATYILSAFFLLGILHTKLSSPLASTNHFSKYEKAKFLKMTIVDLKQLAKSQRAICEVTEVGISLDTIYRSSGKLMVYLEKQTHSPVSLGSSILTKNSYFEERKNTNPHVFDYKRYLNYRGIFHRMHLDSTEYTVLDESTLSISSFASTIRDKCISIFKDHLGSGNALAVASAMVLGERNLLNDELYDAFTDTGAVHVLAVSGLHVGIVSSLLLFLLRPINNNKSRSNKLWVLLISLASVWSFAMLTGAAAAVVRAAIMFSLFFVGKAFSRRTNAYNILSAAAFLMLLFDPNYLVQAGFQFSFLALTGIIFFYPHLRGLITTRYRGGRWIWEMISVSISAQVLVSPLAVYYFHKLPTYFWFTGLIAIPAAFVILILGLSLLASDFVLASENLITESIAACFKFSVESFNAAIFKIQDLPFCSADDLWLSHSSLILLYLALLFLAIYLKTKYPKYLILFFGCLLTQSIFHNIENKRERAKQKLIVYDIYDSSTIDVFYDGFLTEISTGISDQGRVDYITANNRLAHRISQETDALPLETIDQFYYINDKLLLLYPTESTLAYKTDQDVDMVVLSKDSYNNINKLAANYNIKLLVVDGTLAKEKYYLKKLAETNNIPFHSTSNDGALELSI